MTRTMALCGLALTVGACSSEPTARTIPPPATAAPAPVRPTPSMRYFQRRLIEDGEDMSSTFGGEIAMLGLHGKGLQARPIAEAYAVVHAEVLRVADTAIRRKMLSDLFNEVEE